MVLGRTSQGTTKQPSDEKMVRDFRPEMKSKKGRMGKHEKMGKSLRHEIQKEG